MRTGSDRHALIIRPLLCSLLAVIAFEEQAHAQVAVQDQMLIANDGVPPKDRFGTSIDLSSDTIVVGAPQNEFGSMHTGRAYVFVRAGGAWVEQAMLLGSDSAPLDLFGIAVGISGDTVVAGADDHSYNGLQRPGQAYVFVRSGTGWSEQAILRASDAASFDSFGQALAIAGDTILISSRSDRPGFGASGAIYVFVRSGTTWSQTAKLTAAANRFGTSLSIDGDRLVAGSPEDSMPYDAKFTNVGSADVFVRIGGNWIHEAKLIPRAPEVGLEFGTSVAVDGDWLAAGAPQRRSQRGEVYLFQRLSGEWKLMQRIHSSVWPRMTEFGSSVAMHGDVLLVGARLTDLPPSNHSTGVVHVFQRSGTVWYETSKFAPTDLPRPGFFGESVAFDGQTIAVGAMLAPPEGAAYIFHFEPSDTFCYGDGSLSTACPCAPPNFVPVPSGAPGSGCANAFDLSGARLTAGGMTQPELLLLHAFVGTGYKGFAFLVKGDGVAPPGIANDDGIRCVDGSLIRFGAHNAGSNGDLVGSWTYPNSAQTTAVSLATAQGPAQPSYYQLVYRHAAPGFCSSGTTNWTNAVRVDWP